MILTHGTPTTVEIDCGSGTTKVYCKRPDIMDAMLLWQDYFSGYTEVDLCLSGGLDSQFALNVLLDCDVVVNPVVFEYYWEDNVVNSYDVITARDVCRMHELEYQTIQVDIKDFLDHKLFDWADKYKAASPQIAIQLYSVSKIKNNRPIVMGGDIFQLGFVNDKVINTSDTRNGQVEGAKYSPSKFKQYDMPFFKYATDHNIDLIRDLFLLTPGLVYMHIKYHAEIMRESKIHIDMADNKLKTYPWEFKKAFYEYFGYKYLMPLHKRTGFENLRTHLAIYTGVYNQFDITYREPLTAHVKETKMFGYAGVRANTMFVGKDYIDAMAELQAVYDEVKPKNCSIYSFDW